MVEHESLSLSACSPAMYIVVKDDLLTGNMSAPPSMRSYADPFRDDAGATYEFTKKAGRMDRKGTKCNARTIHAK